MGREIFSSPIGVLELLSDGQALIAVNLLPEKTIYTTEFPDEITTEAKKQLKSYFDGHLKIFNIPVKFDKDGFCLKVLNNVKLIPYGKTITYGELAAASGNPKAFRSAGSCVGKNPVPIIVPCHRVVAKNGLGGFGLGLDIKKYLLELEKKS